nr:MAG TPA: hypothetical protein [Caudoviricetes sp.]
MNSKKQKINSLLNQSVIKIIENIVNSFEFFS